MDLKSTNGTILNGVKIEDSRYYELKEKDIFFGAHELMTADILKFGFSTREYVLLREDLIEEEQTDAHDSSTE